MYKLYDVEIEYLESTGTQYIDTGIKDYTTSIRFVLDVQYTDTTGRQLNGTANAMYFGVNAGRWECAYQNYYGTADTLRHVYSKTGTHSGNNFIQTIELDGTQIGTVTATWNVNQVGGTLRIFSIGSASLPSKEKIYSAKVYVDDNLVRDMIPVRVGNIGYLFDKVSFQLFGNAGTGSFTLGPDMYDSRIEYLQATGTQWIDTEVDYDSTVRIMTSMRINNSATGALFGIYYYNGTSYRYNANTAKSTNRLYAYCGTITNKYTTLSLNTWYTIELDNRYLNVNGTTTDSTASTFTTDDNPLSVYIFGRHDFNSTTSTESTTNLRASLLRYMRIWKGNKLVRDFIPVRKGEVGYLYDNVSNRLLGNSGTGTFTLGRDVDPIPTSYDAQVQYIKFTGHQFIDIGVHADLNTKVSLRCYPTSFNLSSLILSSCYNASDSLYFAKASGSRWSAIFGNTTEGYIFHNTLPSVSGNNWVDVLLSKTTRRIKAVNKTGCVEDDREVTTPFLTNNSLTLAGYTGGNTAGWTNYRGYIASLQIRNATGLIRDFIPVRKNGVGYLYDRVTGNMFGNDGAETIGYGPDILQPVPVAHGEGTTRYYSRRDIMLMYQEQVYNCVVSWQSNDTRTSTTAQLYHGQRYKYEDAWGAISGTTFTFWATSYTGRHKTLNVIAGQKYKIKADPIQNTVLVFCNDHVYSASKKLTGIQSATVIAGTEAIVTVPSGYAYMMVGAATSSGSTLILPDRITRLVAYG